MQQSLLHRGELVDLVGSAQYFLPLGEHVEVHGGEEGDVEQHDAEDDQGEGERNVERIWKVDGEKILLKTVYHGRVGAKEFPSDPGGIGDDEESVPEPCERKGGTGKEVDGIHGVSDDFSNCPGKKQQGKPQ